MFEIARHRYAAHRLKQRGSDIALVRDQYRPPPGQSVGKRPRVLLVTPFAVFPPAHGGARRIGEIGRGVAEQVEVLLLSDEASRYDSQAHAYFTPYRSVHLIEGRGDRVGEPPLSLPERVARHAFVRLRAELRRLIAVHEPDIVQIEHMELAALAEERQADEKWVITLHDVYLDGSKTDAWQKKMLARFDALIACSEEDAALLDHPVVLLVPNGGVDRLDTYSPSPDGPNLLFMGPFRYAPNRQGILAFIRLAFPTIRAACPDATLTILGGLESAGAERDDTLFAQAGITLISKFVDPAPYLAASTLTVNPQVAIRGSALKVVDSLLGGRCCVTTIEGARGFTNSGMSGLVLANGVADMADAIIALTMDPDRRHALERPERAAIEPLSWRGSATRQLTLYRQLMDQT
jgi:glycosyltransferase involved in cell wall biosynthesis